MVDLLILGGGQLALMLAESFKQNYPNRSFKIYCSNANDPAATTYPQHSIVAPFEPQHPELMAALRNARHLTFESEFIDLTWLQSLQQNPELPHISPNLNAMRALQDKGSQKKLLQTLNLNTAKFIFLNQNNSDLEYQTFFEQCQQQLGAEYILKWTRQGYDGHGVFYYRAPAHASAIDFIKRGIAKDAQIYAEAKINFSHELAITVARDARGTIQALPLVITEQKNGICHAVYGPADYFFNQPSLTTQAFAAARTIAENLNYVGVLTLEFFLTPHQQLLINEIAPRVHNSAHFSQNACELSQFAWHNQCVLINETPLLPTQLKNSFVMINLLGPDGLTQTINPHLEFLAAPNHYVHWYGKSETRPGRKMGHLNINLNTQDPAAILAALNHAKNKVEAWQKQVINVNLKR